MAATIIVSDHALLRWLERTGMLDIEPIRAMLGASIERAAAAASSIGVTEYLILADGLVYVVRGSTLVTVVPEDNRHAHVHRRLRTRDQKKGQADA